MPGTGVWDSCQQFLEAVERQQHPASSPCPQPSCPLQPLPPPQHPPQQHPPQPPPQQQLGEQRPPSRASSQPQQWPLPMASPFAAPNVQQAAPEPSCGAGAAGGEAKMVSPFGAAHLQEQAFSTGSLPAPSAPLPDAKTLPSAEGPLHQPTRSGGESPPPLVQLQPQPAQQQDGAAAGQQLEQQCRSPSPDQWAAQQAQPEPQQAQQAKEQEQQLEQHRAQAHQAALLAQQQRQQQAGAMGRLIQQQQQQQSALLEEQLAAQQAVLEQQRSEQQQWCTAAMHLIEQQQGQQAQQMDWAAQCTQQAPPPPACPGCRQPVLPAVACACEGPVSLRRAGTANRSVLMVEASSLSRAGSSPGPSRAPSHISQSSMAGAKAEQDEDQQMQEVLSIARELGVFPTCPADLEAQPSWVPPSLGAPPPPLPRADQRRSEESAQSQLQLLLPRSHAPGLTRGHSHPPPASTQQQQQQLLQPAPQLRREEWSAGGGAAPPALLAQPGMQQQPAGRQLSADQLFELAHLLQRAKAAGIQLPQLASWPTQAPGPQAQPPVQPQKLPPQHLHGAAQHQQQLHGLVHQQQQQQVPLQLPRRTETATFEHRSAMLAGLRRQVSADAVHAQHAQQTQHAHHAQQAPPAQQAQQAAMHRQQLMLLEAAQAEQRKQLVQTQHAELLQLEQARQARQAWQAQQAQQAQHTWLAADARRAATPAPISQNTLQFAGPQQQRTAYAAPPPPLQRLPTAQQPPLQQGAASLYAQQQALLAQQRAEQQRWADAALSLLSQATR